MEKSKPVVLRVGIVTPMGRGFAKPLQGGCKIFVGTILNFLKIKKHIHAALSSMTTERRRVWPKWWHQLGCSLNPLSMVIEDNAG